MQSAATIVSNDGVNYYICWNGPDTKGLKFYGGASAAQSALNGGTPVLPITSTGAWDFWFNNFYVAGTGAFAGEELDAAEILAAMIPADFEPDRDGDGELVVVRHPVTNAVVMAPVE